MATIGVGSFLSVAQHKGERILIKGDDLVVGSKGGLWNRLAGWVTGQTARENRAAYVALRDAVVKQYGGVGKQAFSMAEGRLAQGRRLHSSMVQRVLTTAGLLSTLAGQRRTLLDRLPDLPKGSDALASAVVRLGLLGEGGVRLGEHPVEIWAMKNTIPATRELNFYHVCAQILVLNRNRDEFLATVPSAERGLVAKRLDQAVDIARTSAALQRDRFKPSYAEGLARHIMGIRDAGVVERFPNGMTCAPGAEDSGLLQDAHGRNFNHCRGQDSHVDRISRYMSGQGLNQKAIASWAQDQANDSWSPKAQALKYILAQQRDIPLGEHWMGQGYGPSKLAGDASARTIEQHYQAHVSRFHDDLAAGSGGRMLSTIQAWHALNMEFLSKVDLPGNNRTAKTLTVFRTESAPVMKPLLDNGLKPGGQVTLKRGPAESGSLVAPVMVYGNLVTEQAVPHHRVFAGYYFERAPGAGHTTFLNDQEKEVLFMPQGITATYRGALPKPAPAFHSLVNPPSALPKKDRA